MIRRTLTVTFASVRLELPDQWLWSLRVSALTSQLTAGRDYEYDATEGEVRTLPLGRVKPLSIVLATYSPATGLPVVQAPIAINQDGVGYLPQGLTDLILQATSPPDFDRNIDYEVDLQHGLLTWVATGRIDPAESVRVSYHAFGKANPETDAPDYSDYYATPDDFVRTYGHEETIRLTQNGNGEGRDLKTEPDWGKLAAHLEQATAVINSAAGPYLEWNALTTSEYDSRKWIALSFTRYHLDPHQGEDVWKQADLALSRLRQKGSEGGGVLPPEDGTGLDSRYISYGVAPQTFTQERLRQW